MSAVFNPVQQIASIASMAAAGFLASTVLRGMHVVIAGASFGPIAKDTIIGVSGLIILAAALWSGMHLHTASQPGPHHHRQHTDR